MKLSISVVLIQDVHVHFGCQFWLIWKPCKSHNLCYMRSNVESLSYSSLQLGEELIIANNIPVSAQCILACVVH